MVIYLHWITRKTKHIGHSLINNLSLNNIETLTKCIIVGACLSPTFICQRNGILQRGIGKGGCRGMGHCSRDICHCIMQNTIYHINGVAMGRRMGCFETSSLINGYIDHYSTFRELMQHITGDKMGSLISWHKNRTDDDIYITQLFLYIMTRGIDGIDIGGHRKGEFTQTWKGDIRNHYISTHTCRYSCCCLTYDTAAEHQHLYRIHSWHTADEFTITSLGTLQVIGSIDGGHPTCHLTHGYK